MGLIANDQVPIRLLQPGLDGHITAQLIQAGNGKVVLSKPVAGARRFQISMGQNLKGGLEALVEFILPPLHQTARADDQELSGLAS